MGARLRVFLTPTEETTLKQMRHANNLCQRVKERAEAICLSHHGWYVEKIAVYLNWSLETVRKTLKKWQKEGLGALYEQGNRGRKSSWAESDLEYLEQSLREEQRRYNSKQLAEKLERDKGVRLSGDHLRQLLKKKRGIIWKRTRQSNRDKQDRKQVLQKQADLEMLEMASAAGEIDLLYGDESGCCLWSEVGYSYYFRGEQKRQEQTKKKGKRLSIMGLWQPLVSFFYSLVLGSMKSEDFIAMMNQQAKIAEEKGRMRVVVLDNGSIHVSKIVKEKYKEWESSGLFLFFLPPYCSQMNKVELEWQHLKEDELAGQMFDSEQALACHVIWGLESRGEQAGHEVQFINVKSA
jgi:transposase